MNPLRWKREHQLAWAVFCVLGWIGGTVYAWIDSPFHRMTSSSISGEWSNAARVFVTWASMVPLYWPWPVLGAFTAGLGFYAARLLAVSKT